MAIIEFNNRQQFDDYINKKIEVPLGTGTEGICYRGKDGKAYKVYSKNRFREFYPINSLVTQNELPLKYFAFPETIFTLNGNMEAYTSMLVEQNLFDDEHLTVKGIEDIDFDDLIDAYQRIQEEAKILTERKILISDLPGNILFDGKNLVAIDTCSYEKEASFDEFDSNEKRIDDAIKGTFNKLFEDEASEGLFVYPNQATISFLRDIENTFKPKAIQKVYVNKNGAQ